MKSKLFLALALAACTPSLHAATTLLDNTSAGANSAASLATSTTRSIAFGFSTGSVGYSLNSIKFATGGSSSGEQTGNSVTLSLFSGLTPSGSPIASQTFTDIVFTGLLNNPNQYIYDQNLSAAFTVNPNSDYSLVFSSSGNTSGGILTATGNASLSDGTSGATYGGRSFSSNSGDTWSARFPSSTPYLKLTATSSVPEPSTSLLLALGAGGLLTRRRTSRKA